MTYCELPLRQRGLTYGQGITRAILIFVLLDEVLLGAG